MIYEEKNYNIYNCIFVILTLDVFLSKMFHTYLNINFYSENGNQKKNMDNK